MVAVQHAYGTMPAAGGRTSSNKWMMPALAALAATLLAGTAVVLMSSSTSVELVQRHHSLANNYRSSDAARKELNEYFDSQARPTRRHGLSSSQATSQLNSIFPTASDSQMKHVRAKQQKQIMQDLHYSSSAAQDDLDSYFDSMDDAPKKTATRHHDFKAESSSKARNDMDDYWDSLSASEHHSWHHAKKPGQPTPEMIAEAKKLALEDYKQAHPQFAKKLDQVHIDWLKTHDSLPSTTSEKRAYANMVKEVEAGVDLPITKHLKSIMAGKEGSTKAAGAGDDEKRKQALIKYLDQHPEIKAKMSKVKKEYVEKFGHPPSPKHSQQMKRYHDMMKAAIGHIDVSVEAELGADEKRAAKKGETKEAKVAALKKFEENPVVQAKIQKVHKLWAADHDAPPKTPEEEAAYGELMKKYVVPAVAAVQEAIKDKDGSSKQAKADKK